MTAVPNPPLRDPVFLRRLITMGVVEGTSTLLLFLVAMPLKYLADLPLAVTIVGSIHGALFVVYVLMLFLAVSRVPLPPGLVAWGLVGAVVPFGPFVFDVPLKRRLDRSAPA